VQYWHTPRPGAIGRSSRPARAGKCHRAKGRRWSFTGVRGLAGFTRGQGADRTADGHSAGKAATENRADRARSVDLARAFTNSKHNVGRAQEGGIPRIAISEMPKRSRTAKLIMLMTAKGIFSRIRTSTPSGSNTLPIGRSSPIRQNRAKLIFRASAALRVDPRTKVLKKDEARRIAVNVARLPELLGKGERDT
jgi:hypothetical protein